MTRGRAGAHGLGKGLDVTVRWLLRPSKRRLVLDSEVTDRPTNNASISLLARPRATTTTNLTTQRSISNHIHAIAMSDESEQQLTFTVKSSNDAKYAITITANSTVTQLKEKLATSDFADIPTERQRLIYSGRVLKDHETLSSYKIKDGHTIHLVKGAESNNRQNPANQGGSTPIAGAGSAANVPSNIAAGTGAHNPMAQLTGARYAGFHQLPGADMFGADGGVRIGLPSLVMTIADSRYRWARPQTLTNSYECSRTQPLPNR